MKVLYLTRLGKEFRGGADNLSGYLLKKFKEIFKFSDDDVTLIDSEEFYESDIRYFDPFDIILMESSAMPSSEDITLNSPEFPWNKCKIFMHSPSISAEDVFNEYSVGPSFYDLADAGIMKELVDIGVELYYASANHAYISQKLLGSGIAIDISDYRSPNMNRGNIDRSKKIDNAVMFSCNYYMPSSGILSLLHAISKTHLHEFEWYLVGNCLDKKFYGIGNVYWVDYFKEVLERKDVHYIGFTKDLKKYYEICTYMIIPSVVDSYSFRALEGLSYGCTIITHEMNSILPWGRDMGNLFRGKLTYEELSDEIVKAMRKATPLIITKNLVDDIIWRYRNTNINNCEWYMSKLLAVMVEYAGRVFKNYSENKKIFLNGRLKQ